VRRYLERCLTSAISRAILCLLFSDVLLPTLVEIVFVCSLAGTAGSHAHFVGSQSSQFFYSLDVKAESLILKGGVLWYMLDCNYGLCLFRSWLLAIMPSF